MDIRKIAGIAVVIVVLLVAGYALADEESTQILEEARAALNRAEFEKAAQLMSEVYRLEKDTEEAGNALYWEAFARYRLQRHVERKRAVELLKLQQKEFALAKTAHEGEALLARLYAEMAERGEIEGIQQIERMSDEDAQREETRIQALHALMQMDPDKAVPILEKIVLDESRGSTEMRRNALFILCRVDDERSEDILIDMVHTTTDAQMLSELVMCLSMKSSDRALDAIISLFEKSDDNRVTDEALFAIGRHGGDRAFEILAGIARDPGRNTEERTQALYGLTQTGRDADVAAISMEILESADDPEMMEMALFSLSRLESEVPDQVFMDLVNNPNADDDMRAQALHFASRRNDLSLDFLMGVYNKANSGDLKMQVCHVIAQMDDSEESLDALINIARKETDPEIQQNMLHWIGQRDNEKAADYLLEVINQE